MTRIGSELRFLLGKSFAKRSLYSSYLPYLFFLASSINFCCLCRSSLSAGDSKKAGGARNVAGGGGILFLVISSSSSIYEICSSL